MKEARVRRDDVFRKVFEKQDIVSAMECKLTSFVINKKKKKQESG